MLYTSMALERIYHNYEPLDEIREVELPGGRVVAKMVENHYEVDRLISTDMTDYLKEEYMPGTKIEMK